MSDPIVSILLPTYNRARLLERAIQSVADQDFTAWELLILDDASTDNTSEITAGWVTRDPRIRVLRNQVNSYPDISKNLNGGIEAARGKYIARLDDDDYWHDKTKLTKQVAFLEEHPDYVIVGSGMIIVDQNNQEQYRYLKRENDEEIRRGIYFANPFSHTTVLFRKNIAEKIGGYGKWRYAEDWEFWLRLGQEGKMHNLPEYLTSYLVAGQNKSFVHQRPQARMILTFLWKHRGRYPRFWLGFGLNTFQYIYSLLPIFVRRRFHSVLSFWKRKSF